MSGLFGNPNNNKPAGGGLFGAPAGNAAPASQAPSSGLFGSTGNTSQATTGGLFGGSTALSSQPATGGLFGGSTATSQPQAGGLFGGSTAATSQPQAGGLFGNSTAGTSQPQASSLFGSSTTGSLGKPQPQQSQQSGPGLFGNLGTSNAQNQQPPAGGLFGGSAATQPQQSTLGAQQTQPQAQRQGPLSQSTNTPSQSAYFDHLLERGKKRNKQENGQFGELPNLQLGLGDIARKVRNLGASGVPQQARDSKAHYLLAASGVSTGAALKDLNLLKAQSGIGAAAGPQAIDTDVDTYIANLQSQSTLAMIAEGLEQSKRDFDTFLENNVEMEWDAQRKRIYEHLGLSKSNESAGTSMGASSPAARGAFGKTHRKSRVGGPNMGGSMRGSHMAKSVIGTPNGSRFGRGPPGSDSIDRAGPGAQPENPLTRSKQDEFAKKVHDLNVARDQGRICPIIAEFAQVEQQSGTDTSQLSVDAYKALEYITGEISAQRPSDPGAIRERQYATAYLDDNPNSVGSVEIRKRILSGSLRYLEQKFLDELKVEVDKNRQEAAPGGLPTVINTVRAYVRLKASKKSLGAEENLQRAGEDYCWVLVFYLLRAGLLADAVQYVEENERAFRSIDRRFLEYLRAYAKDPNRRLPREKQTSCNTEYKNRQQNPDLDPYRQACNKIVGRCDLTRRTLDNIQTGMEDWIWLQFNLAREINRVEDSAGESFGLEEVRNVITDIGLKHFPTGADGTSGHAIFFFLQILAGMFEQAVNYLYQHNYVSAVHFAIALDYYGLLRVSDFATAGTEVLSFTTRQQPQLNFARMIGLYTMDFRSASPTLAVEYLILIALNADLPGQQGQSHAEVCQEALRELVLETREFAALIGDIRRNGQRKSGAIANRLRLIKLTDADYLKKITLNAAAVADNNGRMTDAVLLYELADEVSKAYDAVLRVLYEYLATDLGTPSTIDPRTEPHTGQPDPDSSLSALATEDPLALARAFQALRARDREFSTHSQDQKALLAQQINMAQARRYIEAPGAAAAGPHEPQWARALDEMQLAGILPLTAHGNTSAIRQCVANMSRHDLLLRNAGNFILWGVLCCGKHRAKLLDEGQFSNTYGSDLAAELLQKARDLMVFAGLVRYKLSPRVYEALAEVGQDVGV